MSDLAVQRPDSATHGALISLLRRSKFLAKAFGIWRLTRFLTAINAAILLVIGSYGLHQVPRASGQLAWTGVGMLFLVAQAQAINDLTDRDLDAKYKPWRPIPAGWISVSEAKNIFWVCLSLALIFGLIAGAWIFGIFSLVAVVSIGYSRGLKSVPLVGNLAVAACSSAPLLIGAAFPGAWVSQDIPAAASAFLYMLFYETLKTIEDVEGDSAYRLNTLARKLGPQSALLFGLATFTLMTGICIYLLSSNLPAISCFAIGVLCPVAATLGYVMSRSRLEVSSMRFITLAMRFSWYPFLACLVIIKK